LRAAVPEASVAAGDTQGRQRLGSAPGQAVVTVRL
jgi:hypothetical protein